MVDFEYQEMFPLGDDTTEYRRLTQEHVSIGSFEDDRVLKIDADALRLLLKHSADLSEEAMQVERFVLFRGFLEKRSAYQRSFIAVT